LNREWVKLPGNTAAACVAAALSYTSAILLRLAPGFGMLFGRTTASAGTMLAMALVAHARVPAMGMLAALMTGFARLFWSKFVSGALLVGHMPTLASGLAGLLGWELVGGAFLVCRMTAFAGDIPLLVLVHTSKATIGRIFVSHSCTPE
jgi:hypothetical protein